MDAWREMTLSHWSCIDAEGDKAFCSGGDIAELYDTGTKGDYAYGQQFWRDEYRLNAKICRISQTGCQLHARVHHGRRVGIGCHGQHRLWATAARSPCPNAGSALSRMSADRSCWRCTGTPWRIPGLHRCADERRRRNLCGICGSLYSRSRNGRH